MSNNRSPFLAQQWPTLLAIAVWLTISVLMLLTCGYHEAFGRFGSVAVVLGLLVSVYATFSFGSALAQLSAREADDLAQSLNMTPVGGTVLVPSPLKMERDNLENQRRISFLFEALLVFFGTLQWGYGDLLHNWFHEKGWTTC